MDKRNIPWEAHLNYPMAIAPGHIIKTQYYPHTPIAFVAVTTGSLGAKPSEDWARLIASAPELLQALRELVEYADYGSPIHPGCEDIQRARDAISKAVGE